MKEIKKLLVGLAETFGTTLSEARLALYMAVLKDCTATEVDKAIGEILSDSSQKFFPLPAAILERIRPQSNFENEAIEAANRIVQAIVNFGWNNSAGAQVFIGQLGWLVVQREGGWEHLCEVTMADEIPTRRAQWRELAKTLQYRAKAGLSDRPPELPAVGKVIGKVLTANND